MNLKVRHRGIDLELKFLIRALSTEKIQARLWFQRSCRLRSRLFSRPTSRSLLASYVGLIGSSCTADKQITVTITLLLSSSESSTSITQALYKAHQTSCESTFPLGYCLLTTLVSSYHGQVPQCQNSPTNESHAMYSHSAGLATLVFVPLLRYFIPCLKL